MHNGLKTQHNQTHLLLLCVNSELELPALIAHYLFLHELHFKVSCLMICFDGLDRFDRLQPLIGTDSIQNWPWQVLSLIAQFLGDKTLGKKVSVNCI